MKKIHSYIKFLLVIFSALLVTNCVHDDKYDAPDLSTYQCGDLTATKTLAELKAMPQEQTFTTEDVVEGYVSSSDETGNIYKYIYLQDKPENPTQGLVVSVDAVSTYANYPQGSKVYIKLKGLALGTYGDFIQLGAMNINGTFGRMPEKMLQTNVIRSCTTKAKIIPKVMKLADVKSANDALVGALVQINNAEFHSNTLCMQYAPEGANVSRGLTDATHTAATTKVAYNSGYSTFANKTLPSGNGTFVGILSKYRTTYQFLIVRDTDLSMTDARIDGKVAPCAADAAAAPKTVAQVKAFLNGTLTQITENATLTGKVIANDETGNLYKYFYVEDATGGLRININMTDLYLDKRFQVGRMVTVNLKDLYIKDVNGEIQIGFPYKDAKGVDRYEVQTENVYRHFFGTDSPISSVTPTEKTIPTLTLNDVGRWIKIKDLQFIASDLGKYYADGTAATNRTLEDCSGNKLILRTSGYADFGIRDEKYPANATEIDSGKGDVYGVLSIYKGTYQLWITKLRDADLDNPRCDGTLPAKSFPIFTDGFTNLNNWNAVSVAGTQAWVSITRGNPTPGARMDGARQANEDWLINKTAISLAGYTDGFLSFETDGSFTGNALEVYVTENYSGNPATTSWSKLNATFDGDLNNYDTYTHSGNISLKAFAGKNVYIGFKYTSVAGASTTWTLDNVAVKGYK